MPEKQARYVTLFHKFPASGSHPLWHGRPRFSPPCRNCHGYIIYPVCVYGPVVSRQAVRSGSQADTAGSTIFIPGGLIVKALSQSRHGASFLKVSFLSALPPCLPMSQKFFKIYHIPLYPILHLSDIMQPWNEMNRFHRKV